MGIDVGDDRVVTVNTSHNERVYTDVRNPVRGKIGDMRAMSIFRRIRSSDDHDGNPLVHAMKGNNGYIIAADQKELLEPQIKNGVSVTIQKFSPEVLIPVPSAGPINSELVARLAASTDPALLTCECFEKKRVKDVLAKCRQFISQVPNEHRKAVKSELSRLESGDQEALFEMKLLKAKIRPYFDPIAFRTGSWGDKINDKNLLFVDDVLSSGSTLLVAERLIRSRFNPKSIAILTMFSEIYDK